MVKLKAKIASVAVAVSLVVSFLHADSAYGGTEALLASISQQRTSAGLPQFEVNAQLVAKANYWAQQMANAGVISHSNLSDGNTQNWKRLGENVGSGPTPEAVAVGLLASPAHLANIIDPGFTEVGTGVAWVGAKVFVAEEFMEFFSAPVSTAKPQGTLPTTTTTLPPPTTSREIVFTIPPIPTTIPAPTTTTTVSPSSTTIAVEPTTTVKQAAKLWVVVKTVVRTVLEKLTLLVRFLKGLLPSNRG